MAPRRKTTARRHLPSTGTERHVFDDVQALVAWAKGGTCRNADNEAARLDQLTNGGWASFWGFESRDGMVKVADVERVVAEGWAEGRDRIMALRENVEVPALRSVRRRGVWADQGDHVDMPRVWSGQLDTAWRRTVRMGATGVRNVRIVVDCCANALTNASELQWRGIAALVAADALCEAGHNVEIVTAYKGRPNLGGPKQMFAVTTKPATAPLDVGAVAATTAFTGFFRGIVFCALYRAYHNSEPGLGSYEALTPEDMAAMGADEEAFLVDGSVYDKDTAQARVAEMLATFQ